MTDTNSTTPTPVVIPPRDGKLCESGVVVPGSAACPICCWPVDMEVDCLRDSLGKDLLRDPLPVSLMLGKMQHGLFRSTEVERCALPCHCFLDRR